MRAFHGSVSRRLTALTIAAAPLVGLISLASCTSDEPGHTKTTTKTTIDTPTEKKTITETHEKDTHYVQPQN
jgi:hypothetical protein